MFSKLRFQFIFAVLLTAWQYAGAQNANIWSDRGDMSFTTKNMRGWMPTAYRALNLQRQSMKDFLSKVPHQNRIEVTKSTAILSLPMPDGSFQQFHLVESPVMEEGLAAKYPEIKTYLGQGIEDRAAVLRCDMTYLGFHAYILSPNGTVYISPYSLNPDGEYISYYKHNIPASKSSFSCGMDEKGKDVSPLDGENQIQLPAPNTGNIGMKNIDNKLRTYRLALACTGEYAAYFGGTIQGALAGMVTTINRVNTVYEVDLAVHLNLIANTDDLIYLDGSSDPYSNSDGSSLMWQNQDEIDMVIGTANYDIGHVFSTGGGGIAGLGVICNDTRKAKGVTGSDTPEGDGFDIDFVAHEIGHQFGGNHTFNAGTGSCSGNREDTTAYEPGSGSTIMAYAGICDENDLQPHTNAYFHAKSLEEIWNYITLDEGATCPVKTNTNNNLPTLNVVGTYSIPFKTPFRLKTTSTDPDGDAVTYCWEQYNLGPEGYWDDPVDDAPIFRSFDPSTSGTRTFPKMTNVLNNDITIGELKPSYERSLLFRCTIRDNRAGGGRVIYNDNLVQVDAINTVDSFAVTVFNAATSFSNQSMQTVKWKVAQSTSAPINCSKVNIWLSTNDGTSFPYLLAGNTPNDGLQAVYIPNIVTNKGRIMVEAVDNIFFDVNNAKINITANATDITTGLEEGAISIYPNPSNGNFAVEILADNFTHANIELYSIVGESIQKFSTIEKQFNISLEPEESGIYFLYISTPQGYCIKKLIKE